MCTYISNNNSLPNLCNICLNEQELGVITGINLECDPRKWNYQILYCGHVICKNCYKFYINENKYKDICPVCKQKTEINESKFFGIIGERSWNTLSEWFDCDNDYELSDYDKKMCIRRARKCDIDKGFWGIYSIIIKKSIENLKIKREKLLGMKKKKRKEKEKYNIKLKKKYERLLKEYTRGWPKNKTLSNKDKEKLKKQAVQYVNNNGLYLCMTCNKNIQNRYKEKHNKNCLKKNKNIHK